MTPVRVVYRKYDGSLHWVAGDQVEMVDLDLDVVRGFDGSAQILDEDEFAEHQVRYGYPPEVTGHAERAAAAIAPSDTGRRGQVLGSGPGSPPWVRTWSRPR